MADIPRPREAAHPTPFIYLKVAVTLAALTGVEVGVFYIDALEPAFLAIFLILSVVKFVLVVLFYMHLKFDARLFSGVFVGGLLLALAVAVMILSLFQVLSAVASAPEGLVVAGEGPPPPVQPPVPVTIEATPTPGIGPTAIPQVGASPTAEAEVTSTVGAGASGKEIFLSAPPSVGAQALWCSQCHTIEGIPEAIGILGPELTNIGTDAGARKPGMSAGDYIRESIRTPEAFVATGVERVIAGLMTTAITEGLTDDQVEALVTFLLEQK